MSRIVRWRPATRPMNIFNEFERLFERPFPTETPTNIGLALDVKENEDGYTVKASVPGVSPDDVEITLEDDVLTIKGSVQEDETIEEENYHLRERRFGSFSRSIRFPVAINAESVEATYENGILTLNVPKAEEVKPKRITIKAN